VEDPRAFVKVGQKVKVKIIEIKEGKISLSMKQLRPNPWKEAAKKYSQRYGRDRCHHQVQQARRPGLHRGRRGRPRPRVSEFGSEEKLRKSLELGKTYPFKISLFDPKEQKMALAYAGVK
jgi:small subunit ribosomal protein S1